MTYEKRVHLVYGSNLTGDLIFMEIEEAEKFAQINDAINNSIDTGISWSKFKDKYPIVFKAFKDQFDFDENDFDEWFEELKDDQGWVSKSEAKNLYKEDYVVRNGLPLMEWTFAIDDFDFDQLQNWLRFVPQQNGQEYIPEDIIKRFGRMEVSLFDDDFLRFKPEDEDELISALERYGFTCERDDDLIDRACNSSAV